MYNPNMFPALKKWMVTAVKSNDFTLAESGQQMAAELCADDIILPSELDAIDDMFFKIQLYFGKVDKDILVFALNNNL